MSVIQYSSQNRVIPQTLSELFGTTYRDSGVVRLDTILAARIASGYEEENSNDDQNRANPAQGADTTLDSTTSLLQVCVQYEMSDIRFNKW